MNRAQVIDFVHSTDFVCNFPAMRFVYALYALSLQILKDDIAQHRALLQKTEDAGQKLIESSNEDPAVVADIFSKLYKVRGVLDKLAAKVEQRQSRLQNVLLHSQEFQVSFDEFLEKLAHLEEQTARQEPVSGVYETVKEQNQEHKVGNNFCPFSFLKTRNTIFAVARDTRENGITESRKSEGGKGGVTDALLRRVTTL